MTVSWFSGGISSFIATYLMRDQVDKIIYTHIDDQHPDTLRFLHDCEAVLGREIEVLQSEYRDTASVFETVGMIKRETYAPCTVFLKRYPREAFELKHPGEQFTYIWGYDYDEIGRAQRLVNNNQSQKHIFPLVAKHLRKPEAHELLAQLKIPRPAMYELGYRNNNCIACVKGGMGYFNKIRRDFPEAFAARANLERELGSRCLKECYLGELDPSRGDFNTEILPACSLFCYL